MEVANPLLRSWQQHSRAGLAASLAHQPALALAHHTQAVQVAHALLALPKGDVADVTNAADAADDDRCAAFVVGHLNLADSLADLDMPAQARECLLDAAAALQAWLGEPARATGAPWLASRHLHHLLAALARLPTPSVQPTAAAHAASALRPLGTPFSAPQTDQAHIAAIASGSKPGQMARVPSPPFTQAPHASHWLH